MRVLFALPCCPHRRPGVAVVVAVVVVVFVVVVVVVVVAVFQFAPPFIIFGLLAPSPSRSQTVRTCPAFRITKRVRRFLPSSTVAGDRSA